VGQGKRALTYSFEYSLSTNTQTNTQTNRQRSRALSVGRASVTRMGHTTPVLPTSEQRFAHRCAIVVPSLTVAR